MKRRERLRVLADRCRQHATDLRWDISYGCADDETRADARYWSARARGFAIAAESC